MAVSGDSAAIKQMLNNMSSEELLKYYDGDSSISASLFNDRTFPFWAFLVLSAFILLFALLRLHAATLTFSILNLLLCALYAGILIFILVSAPHEMDVVRSTASHPGLNLANDLSFFTRSVVWDVCDHRGNVVHVRGSHRFRGESQPCAQGGIRQSGSGESARSRVRWHAGAKLRSRAGRRSGVSAACRAI